MFTTIQQRHNYVLIKDNISTKLFVKDGTWIILIHFALSTFQSPFPSWALFGEKKSDNGKGSHLERMQNFICAFDFLYKFPTHGLNSTHLAQHTSFDQILLNFKLSVCFICVFTFFKGIIWIFLVVEIGCTLYFNIHFLGKKVQLLFNFFCLSNLRGCSISSFSPLYNYLFLNRLMLISIAKEIRNFVIITFSLMNVC